VLAIFYIDITPLSGHTHLYNTGSAAAIDWA
jgi:hypothetical protein